MVRRFLGALLAAALLALPAARSSSAERAPAHVQTWYYYGLNDVNAAVPPEVMVRYADFVEDDGYGAAHAQAYKHAGGRFALAYTDPSYVPYCEPPFAPPAGRCRGPIGSLVTDESAWFHGADGTRVRRFNGPHFQYTEALNPASPAARRAFRAATEALVRKAPSLDFFFADDSGGPLHSGEGGPKSSEFYEFNDAGVEIRSDEVFRDAWIGYLESAARPVFVNGYDPASGQPAYGGAYLRSPRVLGEVSEGCFRGENGTLTDRRDAWRRMADGLLAVTELQRFAVCFMMGTPAPESRRYALASWWLTYDRRWSVAAPIDPVSGESALVPEMQLVPIAPLRTAHRIADLRSESGAYAREFARCFQDGVEIGGCAALVNPSLGMVAVPRLMQRYGRTLGLAGGDVLHGGRVQWTAGVPSALAPGSAHVLAR